MSSSPEEPTVRIIKSDQTREGFLRETLGSDLALRLLFVRCQEAQDQRSSAQDYARLVSTLDGNSFSFCVCDGVGSSFKGDFAAWFLAHKTIRWLRDLPGLPTDAKRAAPVLQQALTRWVAEGKTMLANYQIPTNTPGLLREVLEELRDTYGSETVFFAGRVDRTAQGTHQALWCWMGNVAAQIWADEPEPMRLAAPGDDSQRWSTGRGVRGQVQMHIHSGSPLRRFIVYTDGVEQMAGQLAHLDDDELQEQARQALLLPANDDMTVLDVQWAARPSADGLPEEPTNG